MGNQQKLQPGEEKKVTAAAHGSGLIIAPERGADGCHMTCPNGSHELISELFKQPGNSWHGVCKAAAIGGCIVAGAALGGAGATAALALAPACAAAAGTGTAATVIASGSVAGASGGGALGGAATS